MPKNERKMEHKFFPLEVKDFGDTGNLTGYLATFGNVDLGGDIVEAGAFKKTLAERPVNPLLWHHDPSEPAKVVGSFTASEDAKGLFIDADFLPDPDSQNMRTKVRALKERGVKVGLSIGYQVIKSAWDKVKGEPVRLLKEIRLNEGSLTLFPMNELALVTGVKSDGPEIALEYKPYPNEHSCRLREPGDFQPDSFRRITRKHDGKEYSVIVGKLTGDTAVTEQAYRYDKDTWAADDARAHCKDHGGSFEAARGKCQDCAALPEEPDASTPTGEPQVNKNEPVIDHSLTDYAEFIRKSISN